ncbi:MAG TPA: hypothetical protein VFW89_06475 [Gemmatimonadaceae bacterium]|nr:hypothetical protein [Gemmatimonadaceae bacterium]
MPSMFVALVMVHLGEQTPLRWPPEGADVFTVTLLSLLFGPFLGHLMFRTPSEKSSGTSPAA